MCKILHKTSIEFKGLEFSEYLDSVTVASVSYSGLAEFGSRPEDRTFSRVVT
jgi:hypothetical protein